MSCSYFDVGVTPLTINNRTEPFHPAVIDSTLEILDIIDSLMLLSPIAIITRVHPGKDKL